MTAANVEFPLVHASGESVPLPDASFDIVFCDHGAMSFADPYNTVPEAARLPSRRIAGVQHDESAAHAGRGASAHRAVNHLTRASVFRFARFGPDDNETVTFQLPYGEWIRLFRTNELVVEDLIEVQPPETATSTYDVAPLAWARR